MKITNYREILRLKKLGLNKSQIAQSLGCSRTTVIQVLSTAEEKGISYPLPEDLSDRKLSELLFPSNRSKPDYKMPDYEYVHKELQKNGVTLNLLWLEYCEKCRDEGELPYQLTQFKKHYRDYAVKANATMHLNHKPGEIMQVDWAGDTATVTDTDTGVYIRIVSAIQRIRINKLYEMRLTAMAKAFREQLTDQNSSRMSFEDRFGILVDQEWTSRKNNHLKRLIKQAKFAESGACVEDIEYHADRNLDQAQIARLSSCDFISEKHNVLLLGATGSGKTYIACALGMAAARNFLQVRYVRLPELLTELAIARGNGTYPKVIQQYKKPTLLILDEWLLYPLKETEARDLLEIAEARYRKASTIFCSQFDIPGWREKIGDPILADAICDRIVHDSYSIVIDCKESMRKRKGVNENDA